MFAILGTLLSMLQLLVYSVLARQGTALGAPGLGRGRRCWSVASLRISTLRRACWPPCTVVDAALFAVLLALSLWRRRARGRRTATAAAADRRC